MAQTRHDSINRQREALTRILHDPLDQISSVCIPLWAQRDALENLFLVSFSRIPYCAGLYALNTDGVQICSSVSHRGVFDTSLGADRSQRPYMKDCVPAWGFILSDAYIDQYERSPTITALQVVRDRYRVLGFIAADFDLRDLPITSGAYPEPFKGRKAHTDRERNDVAASESSVPCEMDKNLEKSLSTIEDLLVTRGVYQCGIHFSSCKLTLWHLNDPYRYYLLDNNALKDASTLLNYPSQKYPENAEVPSEAIPDILDRLRILRQEKEINFLQSASINLFNGKIRLNFSGDEIHFMHYKDFLLGNTGFSRADRISDQSSPGLN